MLTSCNFLRQKLRSSRDATQRRHAPPPKEAASARPSFFASGKTSAVCLARPEGAGPLLGLGARWVAEAVTSVGHRPVDAVERSRYPRPAIAKQQLTQIVVQGGWRDQLSLIAMASREFLFATQCVCLPLTRQQDGEHPLSKELPDGVAANGLANGKLAIKLDGRNRMADGSIIARS